MALSRFAAVAKRDHGASAGAGSASMLPPAKRRNESDTDVGELGFRVFVEIEDEVFDFAVGEGNQTARWLSIVARNRLNASRQFTPMSTIGPFHGATRPVCITLDGELVDPKAKLKDLMHRLGYTLSNKGVPTEGEDIKVLKVELQQTAKLKKSAEPDGGALQTTWEAKAFNHSAAGLRRLQKKLEVDAEREAKKAEADKDKKAAADAAVAKAFDKMLVVDMDDPDELAHALGQDWQWVRVHLFTHDSDEIMEIKKLLLEHFVELSDIFKHFAGTDDMSSIEFQQFLTMMPGEIYNYARENSEIVKIFKDSNNGRGSEDDDVESLSRFEFLEALLRVSVWKYGHPRDEPRPGRVGPFLALKRMIVEHVMPGSNELGVGEVRDTMRNKAVKAAFARKMGRLRNVFATYSRAEFRPAVSGSGSPLRRTMTNRGLKANAQTMSLQEFQKVVSDSGFASATDGEKITDQDVRRIFAGAQLEDDREGDELDDESESDSDSEGHQEFVLGEFVDAIARLALCKYRKRKDMPAEDKVERGIQSFSKLDKGLIRSGTAMVRAMKAFTGAKR